MVQNSDSTDQLAGNERRPMAVPLAEAGPIVGLGRTTMFNEAKAGRLRVTRVGRRTIVGLDDLAEWVQDRRSETAAS